MHDLQLACLSFTFDAMKKNYIVCHSLKLGTILLHGVNTKAKLLRQLLKVFPHNISFACDTVTLANAFNQNLANNTHICSNNYINMRIS